MMLKVAHGKICASGNFSEFDMSGTGWLLCYPLTNG